MSPKFSKLAKGALELNHYFMLARCHERRFGNIGDGGQGEKVNNLFFLNLKAIRIANITLRMDRLSNQGESS